MWIDSNNKLFWNVLKGIGILSVVIGHSFPFLGSFVYLYHLPLFFFIAGYLYKEEKYGDNPSSFFLSKIKSNWKKYVMYCIIILLLHNFVYQNKYSPQMILYYIFQGFFFQVPDNLAGPLWFIPIFIIASTIFGLIVFYSRKIISNMSIKNKERLKSLIIVILSSIFGILGYLYIIKGIQISNDAQKAFLIVPFFCMGYLLKKHIKDLNKILKFYIFLPCLFILVYFSFYNVIHFDLSYQQIGNIWLYYSLAMVGIYFCLFLSKIFCRLICIKDLFNNLGKYSFEIMAFHFLVFRIIDLVYFNLHKLSGYSSIIKFPYSFDQLWPIYIVLGTCVPAMIFYLIDKYKNTLFNKLVKRGKA